jgi:alpha-beta hydrolase superfamily lysophospholipase
MNQGEGTFTGAGDLPLFYRCWRPDGDPRGVLAVVHGFGEHSGRYGNLANRLVPRGWAVYGFDHRGHGRSPGQRGHIRFWADYREDVRRFLRFVEAQDVPRPLFLMGHSLGGLIVLECALRGLLGLRGVIASAPALVQTGVSPLLVTASRILSRVWPRFSLEARLDADLISRDPEVVKAYREDPLVHGRGTARLGAEMHRAMLWTRAHAKGFPLPLVILHGGADRLVPVKGSRLFFERITFPDKELRIYKEGYHEPHNDTHREQVLEDLEEWMERHL